MGIKYLIIASNVKKTQYIHACKKIIKIFGICTKSRATNATCS